MSDARRSQTRAIIAFVAVVTTIGAAFGACTSYARANGEECLKNVDCLSGYCIAQTCGNPAPVLAGSGYDSGAEVTDAGPETSTTDSAPPADSSGGDSASDGPAAPVDSGHDSASLDANEGDANDGSLIGDADQPDALDGAEMDASDSSDAAPDDASPDAGDAQDAFNQMSRRAFFV
jgi:hypothetical protein